mmetsp:Transcript_34236/g.88455  ORF Transcript_34236/g.88455 Transcript_34236/m.88455 type:complete len:206 (+) Transcript_34236:942-1559(+)
MRTAAPSSAPGARGCWRWRRRPGSSCGRSGGSWRRRWIAPSRSTLPASRPCRYWSFRSPRTNRLGRGWHIWSRSRSRRGGSSMKSKRWIQRRSGWLTTWRRWSERQKMGGRMPTRRSSCSARRTPRLGWQVFSSRVGSETCPLWRRLRTSTRSLHPSPWAASPAAAAAPARRAAVPRRRRAPSTSACWCEAPLRRGRSPRPAAAP